MDCVAHHAPLSMGFCRQEYWSGLPFPSPGLPYLRFSSVAQSRPTLCDPMNRSTPASLSITNYRSLPKLTSIESVMPSSHLILCRPLFLLPPIPPSIRVFSSESTLHMRWPKYWSFNFSISPSNEHAGLVSFRMDWLDLLAVLRTLKSLLQHHSSKASILRRSAFFTVQLSHPYMTTGKTIALARRRVRLFFWHFSCFLRYACIAMNFPLSTAFTVSDRFWVVVFSFSFVSMHILISFLISSVVCWLFRSVLFSLHMLEFLIVFFFSCNWHLIFMHCDQKRSLEWFQFFWIYQD